MCRDVWAKFDDSLMAVGLSTAMSICAVKLALVLGFVTEKESSVNIGICGITIVALCLAYLNVTMVYCIIIVLMMLTLLLAFCLEWKRVPVSKLDAFSLLIVTLQGLASLSNSLVVNEDKVTFFLMQTALVSLWINFTDLKLPQAKKKSTSVLINLYHLIHQPSTALMLLLNAALGFSFLFNTCREEQINCQVSDFLTPLSSIHPDLTVYKNARFFLMAVPCVIILTKVIVSVLKTRGNLNGYSPLTLVANYGFPILAAFLILHWAVTSTPHTDRLPVWQQVFSAMTIYALTMLTVAAGCIFPLPIYLSTKKKHKIAITDISVPKLYQYIKQTIEEDKEEKTTTPLVYGLSTAISANYVILAAGLTFLLILLGGDGMALSQLLNFLAMLIFVDLVKIWTANCQAGRSSFLH